MSILEMLFRIPIMRKEMERDKAAITFLTERTFSSRKLWDDIELRHQKGIDINRQLSLIPDGNQVPIRINRPGPIKLVPIGDTHLFSMYSSSEAVKRTFDQLEDENAFGFITGDFIEGMHPGIGDHIGSVELRLKEQVIAAADKLRPYFYANKLFCTVDGYFGHEGWGTKLAGISPVEMMSWLMPKPDIKDPLAAEKWKHLPVLNQGGLVRLQLYNGREYIVQLFHNPSSGGSDNVNRHGGLKKQFLDSDDDPSLDGIKIDMLVSGHYHHRAVVSKEVFYDRMVKKERSVVFVSIGTAKGIEVDNTDPFLKAQSKGPSLGPGPGIIINQLRGAGATATADVVKENVVYGYENAKVLFDAKKIQHQAEDMLNVAERQKLTGELIGKISARAPKPEISFNYNSDRATSEKAGRAPLFGELNWNITNLKGFPIMVYLLADARYGSTSHDNRVYRDKYKEILKQMTENPFEFGVVGRHFIDKGVARKFDRKDILMSMARDLGPIRDRNSLLGIMLSETLLADGWSKEVSNPENPKDKRDKIVPSDELYYRSAVERVPLYVNETIMHVGLGNVDYSFFLLDRLGHSGSEFNMVQGLVQTRRKEHVTADITAGGHMQLTGFSINPPHPRVYIPTGWLSDYDSQGKGNKRRVATGGQAAILFSDRKLVIPVSNLAEATDTFNSLLLNKGLTDNEKKKLAKRTR